MLDESFVTITGDDDQIDVSFDVAEGAVLPEDQGISYDAETFTVSFPFDEDNEQNGSKGAVVDLQKISFVATQTPTDTAVAK
ncbi:MAG: hypothetical protein L0H74_10365 [Brachybacterium sp.]|nr:hypothetical protein [Brachybacterium sp.]